MKTIKNLAILTLLVTLLLASTLMASAQESPRVRVILFHSYSCGHCQYIITEVLPPLVEQYGDQLLLLNVEISQPDTSNLFFAVIREIGFPEDQIGVPFMLVGDQVLVGSVDIPEKLPGIIETGLAEGGIEWPDIPSLRQSLMAAGFLSVDGADTTPTPPDGVASATLALEDLPAQEAANESETPEPTAEPTATSILITEPEDPSLITPFGEGTDGSAFTTFADRFNRDPLGNGVAVAVLLFLIGVVIYIGVQFMRAATLKRWPDWILPALLLVGLAIAIYMSVIEVTGDEAICGPVGDCNAVQQSEYATLFGFLPVAVFGMIGYLVIGAAWLVSKRTSGQLQFYVRLGMFLTALFGLLFFIYLTFLEPFVIGATCVWCVSSAIIMALINLFILPVVLEAWSQLDDEGFENEKRDA